MIVTKRFKKLQSAVAWMNSPENSGINVVTILPDDGEFAVVYSSQGADANRSKQRVDTLLRKIEDHINYSEETKRKMGYPEAVIAANGVPYSRLYNSLRNLKAFQGMDLCRVIYGCVPSLGFKFELTGSNPPVTYITRLP